MVLWDDYLTMRHDRDKSHNCKMVDLNKPFSLRDKRVDNNTA